MYFLFFLLVFPSPLRLYHCEDDFASLQKHTQIHLGTIFIMDVKPL